MLKHLTCSQADNWTRLRQVSAEMANKRMALNEAKFGYMESQVKIKMKRKKFEEETDPLKKELLEIQTAKMESQSSEVLVKVEFNCNASVINRKVSIFTSCKYLYFL